MGGNWINPQAKNTLTTSSSCVPRDSTHEYLNYKLAKLFKETEKMSWFPVHKTAGLWADSGKTQFTRRKKVIIIGTRRKSGRLIQGEKLANALPKESFFFYKENAFVVFLLLLKQHAHLDNSHDIKSYISYHLVSHPEMIILTCIAHLFLHLLMHKYPQTCHVS